MTFLYSLNILFFIFITIFKVYYLSRYFRLGFLNPISIPFIISLPVEIMKVFGGPMFMLTDGLFNVWFNYALFVTNIELAIKFIVIYFTIKFSERNSFIKYKLINIFKPYNPKKQRMIIVAVFFLFIFFVMFILLSKDFGLINWLMSPRTGYQLHRTGKGQWYALSLLFLSTSYTIMMLYTKKVSNLFFVFTIYVLLVFLLGSKGFIFSYVIFFIIVLWLRKSKYFKQAFLIVPPIGFGLMMLNFNLLEFIEIVSYFDYYINSAMYFESYFKNEIDLFYGKIWLTDFYKYMPRAIFPDKPFVYGFLYVNEFFYPGQAEKTNTPAFGGPMPAFADFGFIGVILFAIFDLGLIFKTILLYILYKNIHLQSIRNNSNNFYLFVWILAPSFMNFFGTIYSIILFIFIVKIISIFNRIKI